MTAPLAIDAHLAPALKLFRDIGTSKKAMGTLE